MDIVNKINSYFINELERFDFSNNLYEAMLFEKEDLFSLVGVDCDETNDDILDNILFDFCHNCDSLGKFYIARDSRGYWRLISFDKEYFIENIIKYF
jgi:hypothetical protein